MKSVNVIGIGNAGSAIAFSLIPHLDKIYIHDINKKLLDGEYHDLNHASYFYGRIGVIQKGLDTQGRLHIICAGFPRKSSKILMENLLMPNFEIVSVICKNLEGEFIIVTNPSVDLCRLLEKAYPEKKFFPAGVLLDEARLKMDFETRIDGGYILDRKGYTNWGIAAEVCRTLQTSALQQEISLKEISCK